jgi:exodeoxyribonuclease-5
VSITLTDEQAAAIDAVRAWYETCMTTLKPDGRYDTRPFRLFGPAGTGKTTLAKHLGPALGIHNIAFGAYTGKAASVLNRKGVPATTIHSAIYRPTQSAELRAERARLQVEHRETVTEHTQSSKIRARGIADRIAEIEIELHKPSFELNPLSDWAYDDLIVLDEVSMVDSQMAADIESFSVPVLVLGDPEQLPPVGGPGHYTGEKPDVLLGTIHRQALESPVLELATRIRLSRDAELGVRPDERETASVSRAMEAEQVLCWRNSTRWKLTGKIRAKLGRPAGEVVAEDRIMCLVNNKKDLGVLNGQQFDVLDVSALNGWTLLVKEAGDEHALARWIEVAPDGFQGLAGEEKLKGMRLFRGGVMAATFADVITVHKAQGSEFQSVYVIDESRAMYEMKLRRGSEAMAAREARRWLYTAVSRAQDSVTLAVTKS